MLSRHMLFPATALLTLARIPAATQAEVYRSVEVRGARLIPREDIAATCGPLTGVDLDPADLAMVEDCLMYTGVFDAVAVDGRDGVLLIEVTETESRPGRIEAGLAYASDLGLSATLDYEQFNLVPGTYLSIRNRYREDAKSYEVVLRNQPAEAEALQFGIELAGQRTALDDRNYSTRIDQLEVFFGKDFDAGLGARFGLGYRDQRLFDLKPAASAQLAAEEASVHAPFLHAVVKYRDDIGTGFSYHAALDSYLWNLGTDARFLDLRLEARARYALSDDLGLHLGLRAGTVRGLDDQAPRLMDRGFLGGDSFRGFAPRGLGPVSGGDHLGGDHYLMTSIEVQRSLGTLAGTDLNGGVFVDAGSVWSLRNDATGLIDADNHLRVSLGISLNMTLGTVPVQAYLAKPVQSRLGDDEQVFGLSIAARF